tara:strand:- start:203 stop:1480 length:1278 start_codon:yes stop_codon:yes gene_type:complete
MSNYKDHLIGVSSGAASAPPYEQTWNLVASSSGYIKNSSYQLQSSETYQSFKRLATKGLYGGIFDPHNSGNTGFVTARAFSVNQSNGAITVHASTDLWSHSYGQVFSTCHTGAVGHTYMNMGHHKSPSYGSTHKGWIWACEFNTSGGVENYGNSAAPQNMWPHSNGDLCMATSASKDAYAYGRRSTYNQNDSKYWHQRGYHVNGSVGYDDYTNPSAGTSTNYAYPYAQQTYDDLQPNGYVGWQNNSSQGIFTPLYGSSATRASNLQSAQYYGNNSIPSYITGFHLSNGHYLTINTSNNWWVRYNSSGQPQAGTWNGDTAPDGISLLSLAANIAYHQSICVPTGTADTWLMPNSIMGGFFKINIDVNNNYKVTIQKHYHTLMAGMGLNVGPSGQTFDVTGSSNQYFVHAKVSSAYYTINVYDNPFL